MDDIVYFLYRVALLGERPYSDSLVPTVLSPGINLWFVPHSSRTLNIATSNEFLNKYLIRKTG